jgi:hypothetical protein
MQHSFTEKLNEGKNWERKLDQFFANRFAIAPATLQEDKAGTDRWFSRGAARPFGVQYKADPKCIQTGNIFIETVSVDAPKLKQGWVYTTEAKFMVYLIPPPVGLIYICRLSDIRQALPEWSAKFPRGTCPNKGYYTIGILVPRAEFARVALHTLRYKEPDTNEAK